MKTAGIILEYLKAIFSLAGSLAWPAVALVIIFLFKTQLAQLWERLLSLDVPGLKVTFAQKLQTVEEQVSEEAQAAGGDVAFRRGARVIDDKFAQLVSLAPAAAIITKWADVDSALRELARRRDVSVGPNLQPMYVINELFSAGVIGARPAKILHELRSLRNLAAHPASGVADSITKDQAVRFGVMADEMLSLLPQK